MLRVVAGSDAAVWVGVFEVAWTPSWTQPLVMGSVVRVSDLGTSYEAEPRML